MTDGVWILDALERAHARMREGAPQRLFTNPLIVDAEGNVLIEHEGKSHHVMVMYERPYMEVVAEMLCSDSLDTPGAPAEAQARRARGADVLNVGFGCGLVDTAIQRRAPRSHTIVEAHVAVLGWMKERGFLEKAHVVASRWEDVAWAAPTAGYRGAFDGIFFDYFPFRDGGKQPSAEESSESMVLWSEIVRHIVRPGGLCVLYGPSLERAQADSVANLIRVPGVVVEERRCTVDVPFVGAEWEHVSVGRHEVPIFGLRFPLR